MGASWGPPAVNHVEMVHRPGERALARAVFDLLGCRTVDNGGTWVTGMVDPDRGDVGDSNNVFYVSEATPEQWALESALSTALAAGGSLGAAWDGYRDRMRREPQRSAHFGLRCVDRAAFEGRLAAIREASRTAALEGRLAVVGVYYPDDPGAVSPKLAQGFVWTDVVASASLALGQHIELQWQAIQ